MKKVLLKYYNTNNLGDDLFVKIITERYANSFTIINRRSNKYFSSAKNVRIVKNPLLYFAFRLFEKIGYNNPLIKFLAKKNDIFVYIGGSIFIEADNISHWRKEKDFYKNLSLPYYILGSNFGPAHTSDFTEVIRDIVRGAEDVCFRDEKSYEVFKDLSSARVATDIAFTLNPKPYVASDKNTVVISVINADHRFSPELAKKYRQKIAQLAEKFINQQREVVLMSFCRYEGDLSSAEAIRDLMPQSFAEQVKIYDYNGDLEGALGVLGAANIIVGGRFHATILGLVLGKKVLPMAYSDKTINILNDIGFKGPVVDMRDVDNFNVERFDVSLLEANEISSQLVLAEKQFEQLDKVLIRKDGNV